VVPLDLKIFPGRNLSSTPDNDMAAPNGVFYYDDPPEPGGLYDDVHLWVDAWLPSEPSEPEYLLKVETWRPIFHGRSYGSERSWGTPEARGRFFRDLFTEGTRLNCAVMGGKWKGFAVEEIIALTLLTMENEHLTIKYIMDEAHHLFQLGRTPHDVEARMKWKMKVYLTKTFIPRGAS
jgi:hypothetical protein